MSKVSIQTSAKRFPIAPNLYGLFFEDINRSGDSGLYPEMLRNRSFEDSIPPERCTMDKDGLTFTTPQGWTDQFNHGEGMDHWVREQNFVYTPIPAWYADGAKMVLDEQDKLNAKRLVSLDVQFAPGGKVYNIGFAGVPQEKGQIYNFYMFAKAISSPVKVTAAIESEAGEVYAEKTFTVSPISFCRYDASFVAVADDKNARLVLKSCCGGEVKFGFTSLMPADTYNGHGLRKDIMELFAAFKPKFLRFPGGCIVEGFTYETAMRFPNTIGPVWERPSHILMWHYRTTNGLGYHEYLQLCEDLDLEPMYVFNCGLTCQGRAPEYFEGDELQALLQEAIDAIEYAIAPADTKWGKVRAAAGHPAPFKMTYVEIGNENSGEVYNVRYKMCYDALKARFPQIKYISNTHTEKDGLPTDIADEHYYSTPEFFAEHTHMHDNYPRPKDGGPEIFLGEIAANEGPNGTLYAAISEAMYMCGMERNQDVVTLASYAPLLENVNFSAWYPNLIFFDNTRSSVIPTYFAWKLYGNHRGKTVVETQESDIPTLYRKIKGMPAILGTAGTKFKNPVFCGKPVAPFKDLLGHVGKEDGAYVSLPGDESQMEGRMRRMMSRPGMPDPLQRSFLLLGDEAAEAVTNGTFEVEIFAEEGRDIVIGLFGSRVPMSMYTIYQNRDPEEWSMMTVRPYLWTMSQGLSTLSQGRFMRTTPLVDPAPVQLNYGAYNTFKYETTKEKIRLFVNGKLVQETSMPNFPQVATSATDSDEEVIVKIANIGEAAEKVIIELDCDVESAYQVYLCTGEPMAMNTIDEPDNVKDTSYAATGAAKCFTYEAPAMSMNVLVLKKA